LYTLTANKSFVKYGQQFNDQNLTSEISRLTNYFRNKGIYHFQQQNVLFVIDTASKKMPVILKISDRKTKQGDSTITSPFKIYRIGKVNIYTNDLATKNERIMSDSAIYKNFNIIAPKNYVIVLKPLPMLFLFKKTACIVKTKEPQHFVL